MSSTTKNDADVIQNPPKVFKLLAFIKTLKIEFVMFMMTFTFLMRTISTTTLIMDKVCLVHLNFTEDVCRDLASHPKEKVEVELLSNNYIVGHNLIQMLPACIVSIFVGTWSDKYGRKVPLALCMAGLALEGIALTICAAFYKSSAWYVLITAIFAGVSGHNISGTSIIYSYITDISTTRQRTFKYALMELALGISYPLGQLSGGWVYKFAGYVSVFLISACGNLLALAFVVFVLKETKGLESVDSWSLKLKSFFSFKSFIEGMKAIFKPNKARKKMLLLILGLTMTVLTDSATSNINYLYVHHQFDWDNTTYSTVASIFSLVGIFLMIVAVPVFKHFNLGDAPLGITGNVSLMAKNIITGLANHPGIYYLAQTFGLLKSLGTLAFRSSLAKVASSDDVGKVFSSLSSAEALIHVTNAAVVSQIYNATLNVYPGLVFFGAGGIVLIPIAVFIWFGRQPSEECENLGKLRKYGATENQIDRTNTEENHL